MAKTDTNVKILSVNKKARFNYLIEDNLECGIELKGQKLNQ